LKFN
jgi:TfoX/Sxy family transcriptional regulator of competence genes